MVTLDQTLLYPEGGGQPSDTGRIGNAKVLYVNKNSEGEVLVMHMVYRYELTK